MRAARAVKDCQAVALAQRLEQVINVHAGDALLHYVSQLLGPFLEAMVTELCATQPENPSVHLGLWLLERCAAPAKQLSALRAWSLGGTHGGVQNPFQGAGDVNGCPSNGGFVAGGCDPAVGGKLASDPGSPALEACAAPRAPEGQPGELKRPLRSGLRPAVSSEPAPPGRMASARLAAPAARPEDKRVSLCMWSTDTLPAASVPARAGPRENLVIEEEDGEDDPAEHDEWAAMSQLRRSILGSPMAHQARGSHVNAKPMGRKRRFSIVCSSTQVPLPPEEETVERLRTVSAFKGFTERGLRRVLEIARCNTYEAHETIVSYGQSCEDLHIVLSGQGKVCVPRPVGKVQIGDVFGEESLLLAGVTSSVHVEAMGGPITTLSVPACAFHRLGIELPHLQKAHHQKVAGHRTVTEKMSSIAGAEEEGAQRVSFDSGRPIVQDYQMTSYDTDLVMLALKNNRILSELLQLTEQQYQLIIESVHLIELPRGETLMRKGDHGLALYILAEGLLNCVPDDGHEGVLSAGDSFGELALLYETPRAATIVARSDCRLWVLPRPDFKLVTRLNYSTRIAAYSELLRRVPCVRERVDEGNLDMIAGALEELSFLQGEEVCVAGEDVGCLFILYEGEFEARREGAATRRLATGSWIGEEQLRRSIPADETVVVTSETALALLLDMSSLHMVSKAAAVLPNTGLDFQGATGAERKSIAVEANPFHNHLEKENFADHVLLKTLRRQATHEGHRLSLTCTDPVAATGPPEAGARKGPKGSEQAGALKGRTLETLRQATRIGVLGEGSFGSVILFQGAHGDDPFAVKAISKDHITREALAQTVENERSVLMLLSSEFVVKLILACQDSRYIYFLLEPAFGGELFDIYEEHNLFGSIEHARFYIGCCVLGLQHLHINRVVYRDLKLENCLIDQRGYLKLTDMGIAKPVIGKTYTVCGTADYFAPETLRQTGHNRAVDWWACGVLLFIMAAGRSPFDAPDVAQIYKNIIKGFSKVKFPTTFTSDLTDVVKSLCRKKPEERVTMQKGGVDNLSTLPWFAPLDWSQLTARKLKVPFTPEAADLAKIAEQQSAREEADGRIFSEQLADWDGAVPSNARLETPPSQGQASPSSPSDVAS